jgi:hypothetical protein
MHTSGRISAATFFVIIFISFHLQRFEGLFILFPSAIYQANEAIVLTTDVCIPRLIASCTIFSLSLSRSRTRAHHCTLHYERQLMTDLTHK